MRRKARLLTTNFTPIDNAGAKDHPAYRHFVAAMGGRAFGIEALLDAWYWYKAGYEQGAWMKGPDAA